MTPPSDPRRDQDLLLDALLTESVSEWGATASAAAQAEFAARQRRRRVQRWLAQAAAVAVAAAGLAWLIHPASSSSPVQVASVVPNSSNALNAGAPTSTSNTINTISEAEMLAMFPEGSCIVAEIEGRRTLVFFDDSVKYNGAVYLPPSAVEEHWQ